MLKQSRSPEPTLASSAEFHSAVPQIFNLLVFGQHLARADWKSAVQQSETLRYEAGRWTMR